MRKRINQEPNTSHYSYPDSRTAAIEAIDRLEAAEDASEVLALLADIPVRSRYVTVACFKDGTVGIYYSSGEALPRIGRSGKCLPPAGKQLLSSLSVIADSFSTVAGVEGLGDVEKFSRTCVYFKRSDGLRKAEYDMNRPDEFGEDIRSLDAMLKNMLRMIRRCKERL